MGSGISLNTFVDRARLSEDGDVRLSRDGRELINKQGSIGQKIANFFTDIGRLVGLVKDVKGNEAADRQQKALDGFREALGQQFTSSVADQVLKDYGGKLTGKLILDTVKAAKVEQQLAGAANTLGVDLAKLTDRERKLFGEEFDKGRGSALQSSGNPPGSDELGRIAEEALRKTLRKPSISQQRDLDAIKPLVDSMKESVDTDLKVRWGKSDIQVLQSIDRMALQMVRNVSDLPEGAGVEDVRKLRDKAIGEVQDFLSWVSRRDGKNDVNLSRETQEKAIDSLAKAIDQLAVPRGFDTIQSYVDGMKQTLAGALAGSGNLGKLDEMLATLEDKLQIAADKTLALPRGEGPQAFRKLHDELIGDMQSWLDKAGRQDGKSFVNIDQKSQAGLVQYLSAAMHQLLKANPG
jgi:hypothetical protein